MEVALDWFLQGIGHGLHLFMLGAGLTLLFGLFGILNFAHAAFYLLGAYMGYTLNLYWGFGVAIVGAPLVVGALGALFERYVLRRMQALGQLAELLITFGLSYCIVEVVQLIWGHLPKPYIKPDYLEGVLFFSSLNFSYPMYRVFMLVVALLMLGVMAWLMLRTNWGLIVRAALSNAKMVQALGHNVPRVYTAVFALGTGLAGLAGAVGGAYFVTEPSMAATMGPIVFVVLILGGLGSLWGALWAALLLGLLQTVALASTQRIGDLFGLSQTNGAFAFEALHIPIAQLAAVLPYVLMLVVLCLRPMGLLGKRLE